MLGKHEVVEGLGLLLEGLGLVDLVYLLERFVEEVGDLEEVLLDLLKLLHIALLFGVPLADLLDLPRLDFDHFVLHFDLFLVVWGVYRPFSLFFPIYVAVLGECHSLLAFDHLVVLVECNELAIVALSVLHYLHPAKGPGSLCGFGASRLELN